MIKFNQSKQHEEEIKDELEKTKDEINEAKDEINNKKYICIDKLGRIQKDLVYQNAKVIEHEREFKKKKKRLKN